MGGRQDDHLKSGMSMKAQLIGCLLSWLTDDTRNFCVRSIDYDTFYDSYLGGESFDADIKTRHNILADRTRT